MLAKIESIDYILPENTRLSIIKGNWESSADVQNVRHFNRYNMSNEQSFDIGLTLVQEARREQQKSVDHHKAKITKYL